MSRRLFLFVPLLALILILSLHEANASCLNYQLAQLGLIAQDNQGNSIRISYNDNTTMQTYSKDNNVTTSSLEYGFFLLFARKDGPSRMVYSRSRKYVSPLILPSINNSHSNAYTEEVIPSNLQPRKKFHFNVVTEGEEHVHIGACRYHTFVIRVETEDLSTPGSKRIFVGNWSNELRLILKTHTDEYLDGIRKRTHSSSLVSIAVEP
jgi:hypothetical protein